MGTEPGEISHGSGPPAPAVRAANTSGTLDGLEEAWGWRTESGTPPSTSINGRHGVPVDEFT